MSLVGNFTNWQRSNLVDAEYELYDHAGASRPQIACTKYSIPKSVKHHIDFVTPTLHFDVPLNRRTEKRKVESGVGKSVGKPGNSGSYPINLHSDGTIKTISTELSQCDAHITPICLEALYKFSVRNSPSSLYARISPAYYIIAQHAACFEEKLIWNRRIYTASVHSFRPRPLCQELHA